MPNDRIKLKLTKEEYKRCLIEVRNTVKRKLKELSKKVVEKKLK